jgi:5-methylcytosine-specific restriction endonuclease McrA
MEKILAEVCKRDQFTCQPCGKSMEHVERYLVLHLVKRTREARWPGDYELQCTRCLASGQHSLCEVVLEHIGGTYADL